MNPDRGPVRTTIHIAQAPEAMLAPVAITPADRVLPGPDGPAPDIKRRSRLPLLVSFLIAALVGAGLVFTMAAGVAPGVTISFDPASEMVSR